VKESGHVAGLPVIACHDARQGRGQVGQGGSKADFDRTVAVHATAPLRVASERSHDILKAQVYFGIPVIAVPMAAGASWISHRESRRIPRLIQK
jgi:hypothetical protein